MLRINKLLIIVAMPILLLGAVLILKTESRTSPSEDWLNQTLSESWTFYKQRFMVNNERVESNNYGGTISEGQSYALLKAVWMDDPETFRQVWQWTRLNMKRPDDHLFGWRWGELEGIQGLKEEGLMEFDNAADGDQDIAYALLLAGEKWKVPQYTKDAQAIIRDLWLINVVTLDGHHYLLPGTWEGFRQEYLTWNPSYFAPYVYRKFAEYDPVHADGWLQLVDDGYRALEGCANLTAGKLPPNWCAISWQNGHREDGAPIIGFSDRQGEGARDFSYDAFRVYWRMAMDARLAPSAEQHRAASFLSRHRYLLSYWNRHQTLPEGFTATGESRGSAPSGFALSAALAQAHIVSPQQDKPLYHKMLGMHYEPEGYWFNDYNDFLHSVIWLHLYTLSL